MLKNRIHQLEQQLEEAKATLTALVSHEIDAVVGQNGDPILLARAQAALQASEERFRALVENSGDVIALLDANGRVRFVTQSIARVLGIAPNAFVGQPLSASTPIIHREALDVLLDGSRSNPATPVRGSLTLLASDGSERAVEVTFTNHLADAALEMIVCNLRDVTDRRRAEDALRASEARLAITLNSIGDGVLATDATGRVARMNPVAEALTGWPVAEALGRPLADVYRALPEDDAGAAGFDVPGNTGATASSVVAQVRLVDRSGAVRSVSQTATPIRSPAGEVLGTVLVFRDVTEQKAMQTRLLISDRMASLGTMAAGVAHEINNPLAVLIGNLEMLTGQLSTALQKPEPACTAQLRDNARDLLEMLGDMSEAAERMRVAVRDLKLFSRPQESSSRPVDIEKLIGTSLRMAANEVRHRARVIKRFRPVPPVPANEARLGQVFLNLLVNAAQAIPEGRAEENAIEISTFAQSGRVVVEIRDTGPGIAPEAIARIFDPFYSTKPVGVGTGLGLTICQRIVTEMGGSIEVVSEPGHGSLFRVTLPCPETHAAAVNAPAVEAPQKPATTLTRSVRLRRGSVLLVDDEPRMGAVVSRSLADNYDVTMEIRAEAAMARLRTGQRFDVILCDLMMPQMTGIDLYELLRRELPEQSNRVVFLSAGVFTAEAQRFVEESNRPRLDKPFSAAELRRVVDGVVAAAGPHLGAGR